MTFFLHADVYNDYADEDIPDSIGNLPDADIMIPARPPPPFTSPPAMRARAWTPGAGP